MNLKIEWKLFGLLYLVVLAKHVFQVLLLGNAVSQTVGIIEYLILSPCFAFLKYCAFILAGYALYSTITSNKH